MQKQLNIDEDEMGQTNLLSGAARASSWQRRDEIGMQLFFLISACLQINHDKDNSTVRAWQWSRFFSRNVELVLLYHFEMQSRSRFGLCSDSHGCKQTGIFSMVFISVRHKD